MKANNYYIGQTLQLAPMGTTATVIVTVRKVVSRSILRVSYGFDSNGNDIVGIINTNIHLIK